MNKRKVIVIDVANKTQKEVCELLGIEYVPWYKDSLFWTFLIALATPWILTIIGIVK